MSIKISKNQKLALTNTYKKAVLLTEVKSVTNDLLRPIAEEISVVDYPESWGDVIPENADPIAWSDFTNKFYGFDMDNPLWNWLFSHSWAMMSDGEIDGEDLRLLAEELEGTAGEGFVAAAHTILVPEPEVDPISVGEALILRFEVIINNIVSLGK